MLILLISEPNFNFLLLLDSESLSSFGRYKIFDIFALLLILYFLYFKIRNKSSKENYIFNNISKFIFYFITFYILYTAFYTKTSTLLEAFKVGRYTLYFLLYFIFVKLLKNTEVLSLFWGFIRVSNIISFIIFLFELSGINLLYIVPSYEYLIPRIYYTNGIYFFLVLIFGIFQKLLNYKGKFEVKSSEILISIFLIITSLTRGLWATLILTVILILLISLFNKNFNIKGKLRFFIIILVILFTSTLLISSLEISNILLNRIYSAERDVSLGQGTFSFRIESLFAYLNISSIYGWEYTGLGLAHGFSNFVQNVSSYTFSAGLAGGSWGTEMGVGFPFIYFGYVGGALWTLLFIIIPSKVLKCIKGNFGKLSYIFGLSLSFTIFVTYFIAGMSGNYYSSLITLAFLLAIFENLYKLEI